MKLLLYCTKAKPMLRIAKEEIKNQNRARCYSKEETKYFTQYIEEEMYEANGKIVAECDFEVEEIDTMALSEHVYDDYYNDNIDRISKESCLTCEEMCKYLGTTWDSIGYAIHIKNLHIFDEPKELSDYYTFYKAEQVMGTKSIKRAPQNMMYAYDSKGNKYIVISIQSPWMCLILNHIKDVEIRKTVLKGML